jgi:hypothetical protein
MPLQQLHMGSIAARLLQAGRRNHPNGVTCNWIQAAAPALQLLAVQLHRLSALLGDRINFTSTIAHHCKPRTPKPPQKPSSNAGGSTRFRHKMGCKPVMRQAQHATHLKLNPSECSRQRSRRATRTRIQSSRTKQATSLLHPIRVNIPPDYTTIQEADNPAPSRFLLYTCCKGGAHYCPRQAEKHYMVPGTQAHTQSRAHTQRCLQATPRCKRAGKPRSRQGRKCNWNDSRLQTSAMMIEHHSLS